MFPIYIFIGSLVQPISRLAGPETLKTPGHRENTMEAVPPSRRTLNH